jgi:hypothetical protein
MQHDQRHFVTVVSGLPRSGTSLMMQMLRAGGIPPVTDDQRTPDEDNPRGYLEFERVKNLKHDKAWLADASGKAVKIVHLLLMELPTDREYRVIFMQRELNEVVRSQTVMLERSGKSGAGLTPEKLSQIFAGQLKTVRQWLVGKPNFKVLEVGYADLIADPSGKASQIAAFLGADLDQSAMAAAVDPSLYRNRSG